MAAEATGWMVIVNGMATEVPGAYQSAKGIAELQTALEAMWPTFWRGEPQIYPIFGDEQTA